MVTDVPEKLTALFTEGNAHFRVIHHAPCEKSSASVAAIRGTELGQGAKSLCLTLKGNGVKMHVLAVLPSDKQADLSKIASAFGARRASLSSANEVFEFTGCILGAVPPVSFHPELTLAADPLLFSRYEEIAFNAGRRDLSVIIRAADFARIVQPKLIAFACDHDANSQQIIPASGNARV